MLPWHLCLNPLPVAYVQWEALLDAVCAAGSFAHVVTGSTHASLLAVIFPTVHAIIVQKTQRTSLPQTTTERSIEPRHIRVQVTPTWGPICTCTPNHSKF